MGTLNFESAGGNSKDADPADCDVLELHKNTGWRSFDATIYKSIKREIDQ
jgi:hypothetical protein